MSDEGSVSPVVERVTELVAPIVADLGLELYDIDHGGGVLRITVDRVPAVDLDELALLTRLVSRELDHVDVVPGRYTLEVSSPGLERNLRLPAHFAWAMGRDVVIRLRDVPSEQRRLAGRVVAADELGIDVEHTEGVTAGTTVRLAYDQIDKARSVFVWQAAPKPTGAKRKPAPSPRRASSPESDTQEVAAR